MKQSIFVTGIAGSGKSSIAKQLLNRGYEAYDIEDIEGMFAMYKKGTREIFSDYDNADPEKIKRADWLCDVKKLQQLINQQKGDLAWYCGVASNMDEILPLFTKALLLKTAPEVIRQRLSHREGTDDIGNTEASRDTVLGWKDWWEDQMLEKGLLVIDASGTPEMETEALLKAIKNS